MSKRWVGKGQYWRHGVVVVLLLLTFFPIYYMLVNSVKSEAMFRLNEMIPDLLHLHFENYQSGFEAVAPYMWNSIRVALFAVMMMLFQSAITAYCFARFDFPGKNVLWLSMLMIMMMPGILTFIPVFVIVRNLGLLNNIWALILPAGTGGAIAFSTMVLRTFFAGLPQDLLDAARIDGASELSVLRRIVIPLSMPMIATLFVLGVLGNWNSFLWPLVTIQDVGLRTIPLGIAFMGMQYPYMGTTRYMAAYVLASIPLLVLFIVSMRSFVEGLTSGAIKG